MKGDKRLKTVIFCLTEEWREAAQELAETLKQSQISVSFFTEAEVRHLTDAMRRSGSRDDVEKALQTLVLTDSQELARELRGVKISDVSAGDNEKPEERLIDMGDDGKTEQRLADTGRAEEGSGCFACIGCAREEGGYFEGAGLVTDSPEAFSVQELEEYLFHCHGWPVTVAVTERLILREITEQDTKRLYEISTQAGMEHLQDTIEENFFQKENLLSYIKDVYRLQGYGLWSVFLKDDVLIGCCGLADTTAADGRVRLELQYMLDKEYHRRGYGTEMCRAALNYVFARTDRQEVWLRIHEENDASLKLAKRLGFVCEETDSSGIRHFRRGIGIIYKNEMVNL